MAGRHTRQPAAASLFGPLATAVVVLALLVSGAFGALKLTEEKSASTVGRIEVPQSTTDAPSAETPSPSVAATPARRPRSPRRHRPARPSTPPAAASGRRARRSPTPEKTTTSKAATGGTVVEQRHLRRVLLRRGAADRQRRGLQPRGAHRRAQDPAVQHARTGDEPRQRQVGGGPDQRPRPVRRRALHRPVPGGVPRDRQPQPGRVDRQVRGPRRLSGETDRVGQNLIGRGANFDSVAATSIRHAVPRTHADLSRRAAAR